MSRIGDIPDPPRHVARYSPRPFPAYRYVPGVHPHPIRDPAGHSFDPQPRLNRHSPWRIEVWRTLDDWLYGVDLFNHHYFWEAHEAWEALWAAVERTSPPALLLQGLIQIAAALLKTHLRTVAGVRVLSSEGLDKLRGVASVTPRFMGLDLAEVVAAFQRYFEPVSLGVLPDLSNVPPLQLVGAVSDPS